MIRVSAIGLLLFASLGLAADPLTEARVAFARGDYTNTISHATNSIANNPWQEDSRVLHIRALLAQGKYADARIVTTNAMEKLSSSVRILWTAHDVFQFNNDLKGSTNALNEINRLAGIRSWAYRNAPDMVVLGQTALKLGADPKVVLDKLYNPAREHDPGFAGIAYAIGELALSKNDYELAGRTFQTALKQNPKDAVLHFGTARAFASSDGEMTAKHLQHALEANPNHTGTRLLMADRLIDREAYEKAEEQLTKVLAINPHQPEAWAYRSVIAHLKSDKVTEKTARDRALKFWKTNPSIDHLIGKKLSQKYRFTEGSAHQKQALAFEADFIPAKVQLAQDLLRLGFEKEGWALTEATHESDGYDVTTYNLVTLKDTLSKYTTLTNSNFVLRMDPHEAEVYGTRALRLLNKAHNTLCNKYGLKLEQPTTVEIFAKQKDFGVRTFGMPGNPGFLGVCFGCVITANSPASQMPSPANWESVLWHEFCHTVTLTLTKNKMPRWLSEGISVYEERQANPAWGQRMNPSYRSMILDKDLTPISNLSGDFMSPESQLHLQFAYYQSSLVVEHIIKRFGTKAIGNILKELGKGTEINNAIEKHTEPMERLESAFKKYAQDKAKAMAPQLNWTQPDPEALKAGVEEFAKKHPKNYYLLVRRARRALETKDWEAVKAPCQELIRLFPKQTAGQSNAYIMLARAYRELKEHDAERKTLESFASMSDDAYPIFQRLTQLAMEVKDWEAVRVNCERILEVNPLLPKTYRHLALAAEAQKNDPTAIESWQTLLSLDPLDPAEAHYRLARLLKPKDNTKAKRHLLMALEEAPRFRAALKFLLTWDEK